MDLYLDENFFLAGVLCFFLYLTIYLKGRMVVILTAVLVAVILTVSYFI